MIVVSLSVHHHLLSHLTSQFSRPMRRCYVSLLQWMKFKLERHSVATVIRIRSDRSESTIGITLIIIPTSSLCLPPRKRHRNLRRVSEIRHAGSQWHAHPDRLDRVTLSLFRRLISMIAWWRQRRGWPNRLFAADGGAAVREIPSGVYVETTTHSADSAWRTPTASKWCFVAADITIKYTYTQKMGERERERERETGTGTGTEIESGVVCREQRGRVVSVFFFQVDVFLSIIILPCC